MNTLAARQSRFESASLFIALAISAALAVMLARVVQLQLRPSVQLAEHINSRTTARTELPVRGDILDRRGRLLSTTRFGERVVVDPTLFPMPYEQSILRLAGAAGIDPSEIARPILAAVEENNRRDAIARGLLPPDPDPLPVHGETSAPDEESEAPARIRGPRRYVPVSPVLSTESANAVRALRLAGVMLEKRQVREYPTGTPAAAIIGKVGVDHQGLLGTELLLDASLAGEKGSIAFVRDALGRPLWINPGDVRPATPGSDARLSIDIELQRIAEEELRAGVEECDAAGGRLVMLDPATGEVLAMVDIVRDLPGLAPYPWVDAPKPRRRGDPPPPRQPDVLATPRRYATIAPDPGRKVHPSLARNRCVEDIYEPGSTFKPFVWSAITEAGLSRPEEIFDTEGGRWRTSYGRYIEDVTKRATMTWRDVLVNSSNIGMIKCAQRMTPEQLHAVPVRFGFGKPTGVGLPGEAAGIVTPLARWTKYSHTSVAYGHEIAVTPIQMVRAFAAFARDGDLAGTIPAPRLTAGGGGQNSPSLAYRVLTPQTALLTREAMRGVTHNVESRWIKPPDSGWRYELFGKSGTAEIPLGAAPEGKRRPRGASGYYDDQYNSSFIAAGPVHRPRLVCLVVIDDPGPARIRARSHYGSATAGPVVRRVMERALTYLGVPADPQPAAAGLAAR